MVALETVRNALLGRRELLVTSIQPVPSNTSLLELARAGRRCAGSRFSCTYGRARFARSRSKMIGSMPTLSPVLYFASHP